MGRPSNTQKRREEIIQGLLVAMAENGYSGATIKKIGEACNLTPGLIHYHFSTKIDILHALVDHLSEQINQRYATYMENNNSDLDRLNAYIDSHLLLDETSNLDAVKAWVIIGAEAVRDDSVNNIYQSIVKNRRASLLKLISKAYSIKTKTAGLNKLVATVLSTIEGSYQLSVTCSTLFPKGYASEAVKSLIDSFISIKQSSQYKK